MLREDGEKNYTEIEPIPRLLSSNDVAEILGISTKTVNKLVREGKLGCVQVTSTERRFTKGQIQSYIEEKSKKPEYVRVDMPRVRRVTSPSKKGGERSSRVFNRADLLKEMRSWQ
jgi:excisionase family DNA binding protein